ncbi:MAG: glycosyltransferase [Rikenellaceae bacterium]
MKRKDRRKPRISLVLNIAPSYRHALLHRLDDSQKVDFFFSAGKYDMQIASLMKFEELKGFKHYLEPKFKGIKLIWQKGWYKLLFEGYDGFILTANGGIRSNWLLLCFARLMGKKVYLWGHGLYGNETYFQRLKNLTYMRLASGIFLYGNHGKAEMIKNGYKKEKISVIYNSLNRDLQLKYRDRKEDFLFLRNYFGVEAPTLIFLGRLTPQKSLHILLEAIAILKAQQIIYNVILVGSGEQEKNLKERVEELGLEDQVWFYGDCYDESMNATLFKAAWLTVSPGNVGLTAMHSLSYGVPVVTHNDFKRQMPEYEAIVDGVTGGFFNRGDAISLSDAIYFWMTKLSDKNQREKCSMECKKIIDDIYNPENQARLIESRILADY